MTTKSKLAAGFALPNAPKRTEIPEPAARRFEVVSDRKATAPSRLRRPVLGERVAVYLPPELAEALRVRCAKERRSVSDGVTDAVSEWMKGYKSSDT